MKTKTLVVLLGVVLASCGTKKQMADQEPAPKPIVGTWQLQSGTLIEKGDTTITDYTTSSAFIKVINDTHFAFLQHGLKNTKDSAAFSAGGGPYTLNDSTYTEHLEYCSDRAWEGHDFTFTISLVNDTLIQQGVEKVESKGINRMNIEKYIRVKK